MNLATFWHLLSWVCMLWYSSITIYVAVKGASDIKEMLRKLNEPTAENHEDEGKNN